MAQRTPNLKTSCSSWGGGELVQFNHKISVSSEMISLISHSHIQEKVVRKYENLCLVTMATQSWDYG